MKHTAKTVKYNMNLAKKRLNTFSSRLGKKVELDEEYFSSLSPRKADNELKKIRWSNTSKDKGGVSYRGLKIDDAPAPRKRIYRPDNKEAIKAEKAKAMANKKELSKEIAKAQRRLNASATKHTGLTYKIDRDKLRRMSHQDAMKAVKQISYKMLKNDPSKVFDYIKETTQKGVHPIGKYNYETAIDKAEELTKAIIDREKTTGELRPARIYGKTAQDKVLEYYQFLDTKEKLQAFRRRNAEMAENNLINNFKTIGNMSSDRVVKAVAKAIVDLYHEGVLTIDNTSAELHNTAQVDMFDSDVPEEVMVASAERIVDVILSSNVVSDEEIRNRLKAHGLNKYEIDELLGRS